MLNPTDKERLATLEAGIPWIKELLDRLVAGQEKLHNALEAHIAHPANGNGSNGGVQIIIGKKALGGLAALAALPIGGTLTGIIVYLKSL